MRTPNSRPQSSSAGTVGAIRFGICGLGRIGTVHARHFSRDRERYQLVAVCDFDKERTRLFEAEYGCAGYDRFERFLEDPEMELVIIATRSLDHAANAVQALAAGKLVLLEKPIAVTEDDLRILRQADHDYPGQLFCMHNHRFEAAFENILEIIRSGILGELQVVKLCRHHPFRRRADWQMLLGCGGGQLSVWGPHLIDQALQYINAPVKDVWGYLKRIVTPGDADDHMRISIMGENNVVAELEVSDAVALSGAYCTVYGSRGSLVCADEKNIQLKYIDPSFTFMERSASPEQPPQSGGYGEEETIPWIEKTVAVTPDTNMWELVKDRTVLHLFDAIRREIPFPVTNAEAFEVVRVTEIVKRQNSQFRWKE